MFVHSLRCKRVKTAGIRLFRAHRRHKFYNMFFQKLLCTHSTADSFFSCGYLNHSLQHLLIAFLFCSAFLVSQQCEKFSHKLMMLIA